LCHNIPIDQVDVRCTVLQDAVEIRSEAVCTARTGIEMEALTAAAVAALTIYDMCKAVDKGMVIEEIRLLEKSKGPAAGSEP
jgi:cyclic pyranopterin phosphate synthase